MAELASAPSSLGGIPIIDVSHDDDATVVDDAGGALLAAVPQVGDKQRLLRLLRSAADATHTLDAGSVQLLQLLGWKASGGQPLRRPADNDATNLQLALAVSALDYAIFREGAHSSGGGVGGSSGGGGSSNEPAPAVPPPAARAQAPSAGDCVVLKGIVSREELNGKRAVILGPAKEGRFNVRVDGVRKKLAIKAENLELEQGEAEEPRRTAGASSRSDAVSDDDVVEVTKQAGKRPRQQEQPEAAMDLAPTPQRRAPSSGSAVARVVDLTEDSSDQGIRAGTVAVRLLLGTEPRVQLRVDFDAQLELSLLYSHPEVQKLLRKAHPDAYPAQDDLAQLAESFTICTEDGGAQYGRRRASSVSFAAMIAGAGGGTPSLRLRVVPAERAHRRQSLSETSGLGKCEAVKIVRLRYRSPSGRFMGQHVNPALIWGRHNVQPAVWSPILLIKNFNVDGGIELSKKLWQKSSNPSLPHFWFNGAQLAHAKEPLERAADRVLDMCEHVCKRRGDDEGRAACCELQKRTAYNMHAARHYQASQPNSLPPHVDGLGNWVVLFSFGCSVDFEVGGKTVLIESGDALVFNGGPAHGVVHGISRPVHRAASHRGKEKRGLVGLHPSGPAFDDCRVSVQARQV